MIKGLCGQPTVMHFLINALADKVCSICPHIDYIDGNVTGGVVTGWELRNKVSEKLGKNIPFVYLRGARKRGGHDELITGIHNNSLIKKGMEVIVVEELVNYGTTTINAVDIFREYGYKVNYAATILSYNHKSTMDKLKEKGITLIPLITLDSLLAIARKNNLLEIELLNSYESFLNDSINWQLNRFMPLPEETAMIARERGYNMIIVKNSTMKKYPKLQAKVEKGVQYYEQAKKSVIVALDDLEKIDMKNIAALSQYNEKYN